MPNNCVLILRYFWKILANFNPDRSGRRAAIVVLAAAACALGQSTLTLSSATAPAGTMANLNLSLSDSGVPPAGLEWTLTYSAADLAAVNVTPGPAATAAGKTVSCAGGNGTYS